MEKSLSSIQWINLLGSTLESAKGKVGGEEVKLEEAFQKAYQILDEAQSGANTVWWVGNGGSNAIGSHLSQDVMNKLNIRSHAFNDSALITCMANDFGYENVYSLPLSKQAKKGDILIAISSSGRSKNILNAVSTASKLGMKVISLSGFSDQNDLWKVSTDVAFYLQSELYGIVEVGHEALLHALIESKFLQSYSSSPV